MIVGVDGEERGKVSGNAGATNVRHCTPKLTGVRWIVEWLHGYIGRMVWLVEGVVGVKENFCMDLAGLAWTSRIFR